MAAQSIDQLRNNILTSIYGRRMGMTADEFLVGQKDIQTVIEEISTTAATSALNYGHTRVLTSGSTQLGLYTLQAPKAGVRKLLTLDSSSTGNMQFQLTGAVVWTSSGSSGSTMINLRGNGAVVELIGVSSAIWRQINNPSTAQALVLFSTTT